MTSTDTPGTLTDMLNRQAIDLTRALAEIARLKARNDLLTNERQRIARALRYAKLLPWDECKIEVENVVHRLETEI